MKKKQCSDQPHLNQTPNHDATLERHFVYANNYVCVVPFPMLAGDEVNERRVFSSLQLSKT